MQFVAKLQLQLHVGPKGSPSQSSFRSSNVFCKIFHQRNEAPDEWIGNNDKLSKASILACLTERVIAEEGYSDLPLHHCMISRREN